MLELPLHLWETCGVVSVGRVGEFYSRAMYLALGKNGACQQGSIEALWRFLAKSLIEL